MSAPPTDSGAPAAGNAAPAFRILPLRLKRIRARVDELERATDPAAALAALFLLHCACKDVLKDIPTQQNEEKTP